MRVSQIKSESDSGLSGGREELSSTSPTSLHSVEAGAPNTTPPPPKPSRRGKSVKFDPSGEDRSKTLGPNQPTRNPPETHGYTSTTLPHHFKVGGQKGVEPGGGSGSPKPVPRPRTSVGMLGNATKPPEGNVRSNRKEVSAT